MYNHTYIKEWHMQDFFVLGQIPGTSIIISFTMWMQLFAIVLAIAVLISVRRSQAVKKYSRPTISNEPVTQ
jgi:hypothetical protein